MWVLGRSLHRTAHCEIALCRPVDSGSSRRWDYIIKRSVGGHAETICQINQSIALASEINHPNIVPVLDGNVTTTVAYLVMPYLDGVTMQSHLVDGPSRPLPVALWLVRQIAQALKAMHIAGWSHGDVKPNNVIIGTNGHATLIDTAFAAKSNTPVNNRFRGTPEFAAPELLENPPRQTAASDTFSLGKILWQWLIATDVNDDVLLTPIAELVERMLDETPEKRPTAEYVARQLLRLEIDTLGQHIGPQRRAA